MQPLLSLYWTPHVPAETHTHTHTHTHAQWMRYHQIQGIFDAKSVTKINHKQLLVFRAFRISTNWGISVSWASTMCRGVGDTSANKTAKSPHPHGGWGGCHTWIQNNNVQRCREPGGNREEQGDQGAQARTRSFKRVSNWARVKAEGGNHPAVWGRVFQAEAQQAKA